MAFKNYTIFDQCGVSITDLQTCGDYKVEGKINVRWTESGNRCMLNIFDYEGLAGRKAAMADALKFAAEILPSTDF